MSDTKHTGLPWTWCVLELEGPEGKQSKTVALQYQIRALSLPLAESHVAVVSLSERGEANAEFIVRACNAHDELVVACEMAEVLIARDIIRDDANCLARIRAAIAKVKGKPCRAE